MSKLFLNIFPLLFFSVIFYFRIIINILVKTIKFEHKNWMFTSRVTLKVHLTVYLVEINTDSEHLTPKTSLTSELTRNFFLSPPTLPMSVHLRKKFIMPQDKCEFLVKLKIFSTIADASSPQFMPAGQIHIYSCRLVAFIFTSYALLPPLRFNLHSA